MRRLLNLIYGAAAAAAALCMVGLLVMVMLSVISREFGFNVPGVDAYAGYLMAGAGFLALAHTLKMGEHIRVSLVLNALSAQWQRRLQLWSLALASAMACFLAYYSCRLVWQSVEFNDISTGNDATPLWIPQLSMALGSLVFAIAFIDDLVLELMGKRQRVSSGEIQRNE